MVVYFVMIGFLPSDCLMKLKCDRIIRFFFVSKKNRIRIVNQWNNLNSCKFEVKAKHTFTAKHRFLQLAFSRPLEFLLLLTSTLSARDDFTLLATYEERGAPTSRTTSIWLRREILSVTLYKELSVVFEDQKRKLWFYTQTQATLSKLRIVRQLLTT